MTRTASLGGLGCDSGQTAPDEPNTGRIVNRFSHMIAMGWRDAVRAHTSRAETALLDARVRQERQERELCSYNVSTFIFLGDKSQFPPCFCFLLTVSFDSRKDSSNDPLYRWFKASRIPIYEQQTDNPKPSTAGMRSQLL